MNGTGGFKNLDWISHQPPVTRLCLWWSWALDLYCIASFVQCLSLQPTVPVQDFRRTLWNLLNMSRWYHQSWRWRCFTDWPAIRLVVCPFFSFSRCIRVTKPRKASITWHCFIRILARFFPAGKGSFNRWCVAAPGWAGEAISQQLGLSRWTRWTKWEP